MRRALDANKVVVLLLWNPKGTDDKAVKSAVDSALDLGARRAEGELAGPFPWAVMLDPEGNEFCLCPPDCPPSV